MKKGFARLGILFLIFIVLSQIALVTLPFSWGNTRLNTKYTEYKKNHEQYNTLFMGASTTYRHLDCKQFDDYVNTKQPELNIKSFNFGIPANRTPQSVYTLQKLVEYDTKNLKYIVLDLSELTKMGIDNLHKKEMIYWYTWGNIGNIMKASYESEKKISDKIGVPALHLFSFVEKSLMFGMGTTYVSTQAGLNIEQSALGKNQDGFYSLDQEMHDQPEGDLARRYEVLRTIDTINFRTERCQKLFDKYKNDPKNPNVTIAKNLNDLIVFCAENNIKLIFMLSQRLGDRYEYLIPLFNQLPEENRIGFADPSAYPQLNDINNLFDLAHLNANGAKVFTQLFADLFLERIKMQNSKGDSNENSSSQKSDQDVL